MSNKFTDAEREAFLDSIPNDKELAFARGWAEGFADGMETVLEFVKSGEITREMLETEEDDEEMSEV